MYDDLTDVPGLQVGHYTDRAAATGCTVVLCGPEGAVGGVVVRGASPGSRETELLRPGRLVSRVHAVLLAGGSAFGLDAAGGVMRCLEERGIGFETRSARVPIVPAAILYDLGVGDSRVRPGPEQGYAACLDARTGPVVQGTVGAGTGATVGKALGIARAVKSGIGSASVALPDSTIVAALVAVNAVGDVVDPDTGAILAGPRGESGAFLRTLDVLRARTSEQPETLTSTTIGVVATSATLDKEQTNRLAEMADDGLALAIRPAHTMSDGDLLFALATGAHSGPVNLTTLGAVAATVVARAITRAVLAAEGLAGVPSLRDLQSEPRP